jgi:pimeloyl-ACP methyl ester carboxylesterase
MDSTQQVTTPGRRTAGDGHRERLHAGLPVTERRLQLAGVSTAVLEGGAGPPLLLLHGPGAFAAAWLRVIPDLATTHRVVAPDLPGQGSSTIQGAPLDVDRVVAWLGELIDSTCPSPPVVVGHLLGGAIAARFAADNAPRLDGLVLVDTFGLTPFEPSPEFGAALMGFLAQPTEETLDGLWQRCSFDFGGLQRQLGERWDEIKAYTLDLATTPAVADAGRTLMEQFALPAIPPETLARISVPTSLIWGRHDLATPVEVAEAASSRYGWPLQVIEKAADDPTIDQPDAFLRALRVVLEKEGR